MLGLTRPGVDPQKLAQQSGSDPNQLKSEVYAASGSGVGAAVTGTAVVGLHF
jgi:hypothetical protein